jgi:hypothetical protein
MRIACASGVERFGALYLAFDMGFRLKLGISNSSSHGHTERIAGRSCKTYWGAAMHKHWVIDLGKMTSSKADCVLKIYELLMILGLNPFLINAAHEVCFLPPGTLSLPDINLAHHRLSGPVIQILANVLQSSTGSAGNALGSLSSLKP